MIGKIKKYTDYIEVVLLAVIFTVLLCLMMYNVVTRYVFGFTLGWIEQFCRLLFVWASLIGISYAAKLRAHLRVSAVAVFLKGTKEKILLLIGDTVATVFAFYMAYRLVLITINIYMGGATFISMPSVPIWILYVAGILGMAGFAIRTIQYGIVPEIMLLKSTFFPQKIDLKGGAS